MPVRAQPPSKPPRQVTLPVVPLRGQLPMPGTPMPLAIGRPFSLAAIRAAREGKSDLVLLMQREQDVDDPGVEGLHRVGVTATPSRNVRTGDGSLTTVVQAQDRVRVLELTYENDYYEARVEIVRPPELAGDVEADALVQTIRNLVSRTVEVSPTGNAEFVAFVHQIDDPALLADVVASQLNLSRDDRQMVLETFDVKERLAEVARLAAHAFEVAELGKKIQEEVHGQLEETRRKAILREQLKAIRKEMGEEQDADVERISKLVAQGVLNAEAQKVAERELQRLEGLSAASPERGYIVNYLDWLVALPWTKLAEERKDLEEARAVLDREHYGMEKAKERILETLAVRLMNPDGRAPILCFVGPPGTGKTSLAQAVAEATGRELVRISVGGVSDESEIRGHRRTYVGAMPGRIIAALRKAGSRNPVFVVDEIDKMSASFHGDPAAALLEVLDPEQNSTFADRYIEVPFDLSRVLFITTANTLATLARPLLDRLEVIEVPGYTEHEKVEIAVRHLLPRQRSAVGLAAKQVRLGRKAIRAIIRGWTREAGVRNLERSIGGVMRKLALKAAHGETGPWSVREADLQTYLGPRRFFHEAVERMRIPGVAMGLAWTPVGGEILFIEAAVVQGKGGMKLTGSLGDVMKESAIAALTWLRSSQGGFEGVEGNDYHIHVPAGAVPKDGPSAGVAMLTALASAITGRLVRHDVAMTGEITLRGQVLPVGGIRDKVLAAARAGVKEVILPRRNEIDLDEVPEEIRSTLTFHLVDHVADVLELALRPAARKGAAKNRAVPKRKAARAAAKKKSRSRRARSSGRTRRAARPADDG